MMGLSAAGGFLPPVVAEILAKTDEFTAGMMKARSEMEATAGQGSTSFGKLATVGKAAFIALGVAAVAVGVESIKMADEFETSHARLTQAITNTNSSFGQWKSQIDAVDKTMEHLGFSNTTTEAGLATLVQVTHNTGTALGLMGLAADIARGRHIDLSTAVGILTKVETGHVALLGRMGINTKDATGATISQAEAIKRLTDMYGGQAAAYTQTFSGKMATLQATVTDLGTQLGLWLIPKVEAVASALASTFEFFNQNRAAAEALAIVVGGPLAVAMGAFVVLKVQSAIQGITKAFELLTGAAGRAAAAATTQATAESAAAAADAAEATSALAVVAALGGEAAAQEAEAAAAATRAAAESAAAATGALDSVGSLGAAGLGTGAAVGGIAALGAAAVAVIPPLAMIGWTIWDDGQRAKQARAEVSGFLSDIQTGAANALNPTRFLADSQTALGNKIQSTQLQLSAAQRQMNTDTIKGDELGQAADRSLIASLTRRVSIEKTEYASLAAERKKVDDSTTANHVKAVAAQSAADEKALAKAKADANAEIANVGAHYGILNEKLLQSQHLSADALKAIEQNVKSALTSTDSAISGYTDVVAKFGDQTKVSSSDIIKFLRDQVVAAAKWSINMKTLAHDGIDQGLLQELYQAGPKSAGLVQGLLDTVSKGGLGTVNDLVHASNAIVTNTNQTLSSIMIQGEGQWNAFQQYFASHPITGNVVVNVTGQGATLFNPQTGKITVPGNSSGGAPVAHTAGGGDRSAGSWSWVGEQGPELVRFGRDATVYPAGQSRVMASGPNGQSTKNEQAPRVLITGNTIQSWDDTDLARRLMEQARRAEILAGV